MRQSATGGGRKEENVLSRIGRFWIPSWPTRAASPTREKPTMFAKRDMAAVCEEDVRSVRLTDLPLTSTLSWISPDNL